MKFYNSLLIAANIIGLSLGTDALTSQTCSEVIEECPDLDFTFHSKNVRLPLADISISEVVWTGGDTYDVTVNFKAKETLMDIKYLTELKLLVDGGVIFSRNSGERYISDPSDWSFTIALNLVPDENCRIRPKIDIQYDWCTAGVMTLGDDKEATIPVEGATEACAAWSQVYEKSYDYSPGCNHDA
ncbi:uncharacterized protein CYBJADRAFT_174667, partial [Cyberlindnera jadinii NRRL Y-1542]